MLCGGRVVGQHGVQDVQTEGGGEVLAVMLTRGSHILPPLLTPANVVTMETATMSTTF